MRAVVASDLHLHNWKEFAIIDKKTGLNTRLLDGIRALQQIRRYMNENEINHFFFLGDILHRGNLIPPDILEALINELRAIRDDGIRSIFLCGQHDQMAAGGLRNALRPLRDYVTVIDEATTFEIEGIKFAACPCRKTIEEQYAELEKLKDIEAQFFLGHFLCKQLIEKSELIPAIDFHEVSASLQRCELWLLGDYHPAVDVRIDGVGIISVGSLVHQTFGDASRKKNGRFIDIPFSGGIPEYIYVKAPMFFDLMAKEFLELDLKQRDFFRVHVSNVEEQEAVSEKAKEGWHVRLVYEQKKDQVEGRIDVDVTTVPETVIEKYVEHVSPKDQWDELKKMGVAYLK